MSATRTKKAFINTFALATKAVVALLCNFLLPRLILGYFGSTYNGLISSITQFLNIVSILKIGVAGSTRVELYKSLSEHDSDKTSSVINATQRYMARTGLIVLVYFLVLTVVYPLVFRAEISYIDVLVLVVALGATAFSQYVIGTTYTCLLVADQRAHVIYFGETAVNIVATVTSCLLILVGWNLPWVKLVACLIWIIYPLFLYFYCHKKYKINKKIQPMEGMGKKRRYAMAHSIANIIHDNVDIFCLTIFFPPAIVSVYAVYRLVMNGIRQILAVFTNTLEAPFGDLIARNKNDLVEANLSTYEFISGGFVGTIYPIAACLLLPFIALYTRGVTDVQYILPIYAVLIIASESIYALRGPYQTIIQAAGHYKQTRIHAYIEAGINLVVTIIFINILGIIGAVIGTLCANLYRTIVYCVYSSKRIVIRGVGYYFNRLLWVLLLFFTIFIVANKLNSFIGYDSWYKLVICGFVDVTIALMVFLITSPIFYKEDFSRMLLKAKSLFHFRKAKKHE